MDRSLVGEYLIIRTKFLALVFVILVVVSRSFAADSENAKGICVKGAFTTIQDAINNANVGDTIHVPAGTYYEHVVVNKTVTLVGENDFTTIIDGSNSDTVVQITAYNVSISSFKLQNSGWGWTRNGIYVYMANNCEIQNNFLFNNCHNIRINCSVNSQVSGNTINGTGYGIRLINSINCSATNNTASDCIGGVHLENATGCTVSNNYFTQNNQGIRLYSPCAYNVIEANTVYNNTYSGMIEAMPGNATFFNNFIFHNNFVNNSSPFIYKVSGNVWDDGYPSGGNYWSDYNDTDQYSGPYQNVTGSDGIGDKPYAVNSLESDRYPLMKYYNSVRNLDTNLTYSTLQAVIDASETLDGHTIWVGSGIYRENVNVRKSLKLVGESPETTIIDGSNVGTVIAVNANNVTISNFTIYNSGTNYPPYGMDCGIFLNHSVGSNISHNLILMNRIGIYLSFSEACFFEDNKVASNYESGIWLWYSGGNVFRENEISNSSYNFGVFGGDFSHFNNSIDASNTVDGKQIQYLIGVENATIDAQTSLGVLYLINCRNVTARDLNLTKNGHGIFCYNLTGSRIENVTVTENNYGIHLQDSRENRIDNNSCLKNWVGVYLQDSNNNSVESNIVAACEKGISLYDADNNSIISNTISDNLYGMRFFSSNFNSVFHNNLVENDEQVDLINSYQNAWDDGIEGNFWSNYTGPDTNRDGLGETPQTIDGDNYDPHPLLGYLQDFEVHSEGHVHAVTVVSNSTVLDLDFDITDDTIRLRVNGSDGHYGFCRIRIPYALVRPEFSVVIDNETIEVLYPNYNLRDDGFNRWIYFAYLHSTHEILIIPEYPPLCLMLTLMFVAFSCLLIRKHKSSCSCTGAS